MKKHPWHEVKAAYVEGTQTDDGLRYPTFDQLAKRFGISPGYLRAKAAEESWSEQRSIFQAKVEQRQQEKKSEILAGRAAEFDANVLKTVDALLAHTRGHILRAQDRFRESKGTSPLDVDTLDMLSTILGKLQKVGRLALGEPTEGEREVQTWLDVLKAGGVDGIIQTGRKRPDGVGEGRPG